MYKELIKRNIAFLLEKRNNGLRKFGRYRVSFFSDIKRKEIIVWIRLQKNKDKDQIKEFIEEKFSVSDSDAEKLFYEAYPDGLDSYENKMLDQLDDVLRRVTTMRPSIVSDIINSIMGGTSEMIFDNYNIDESVKNQITLVIGTLLKRRDLV